MKKVLVFLLVSLIGLQPLAPAAYGAGWPADLAREGWVSEAVAAGIDAGWVVLPESGLLMPEAPASREFVALLLTRAWPVAQKSGRVTVALPGTGSPGAFSDLSQASPEGREALLRLNQAGVLTGYPQGTLAPAGVLTRLEMAVIFTRLVGEKGAEAGVFSDEEAVPAWGTTAVRTVAAAGLMTGYEDGSFRPFAKLSRAEAVVLVARWLQGPAAVKTTVSRGTVSLDSYSAELLKLVNAERSARGLAPLKVNRTLTALASDTAADMAAGGYFSHVSPDGTDTADRFAQYGFVNQAVGENMLRLKGSISAQRAVSAWMNSERHRAIILTPYTDTGIGLSKASDGTLYITQTFADL